MSSRRLRSATANGNSHLPPTNHQSKRKRDSLDPHSVDAAPPQVRKQVNRSKPSSEQANIPNTKTTRGKRKVDRRNNEPENRQNEDEPEPQKTPVKQTKKRVTLADAQQRATTAGPELQVDDSKKVSHNKADHEEAPSPNATATKKVALHLTNTAPSNVGTRDVSTPSRGVVPSGHSAAPALREPRNRSTFDLTLKEVELLAKLCLPLADICKAEERDRQAGVSKRINLGGTTISESEFASILILEVFKAGLKSMRDEKND